MEIEDFVKRLTQLRMNKGVSARSMSLDIGQNENYINDIENERITPSLAVLFYIFDYLAIEPKDFFDLDVPDPKKADKVYNRIRKLPTDKLNVLIAIMDSWEK